MCDAINFVLVTFIQVISLFLIFFSFDANI